MVDEKLAFAPAHEVAGLIATKEVSPVEVTELYFERIDRLDPQLNAYLALMRDEAMEAAKAAEDAVVRGDRLGPLHGVPISVKDMQMTRGVVTTTGSLAYKDRVPENDDRVPAASRPRPLPVSTAPSSTSRPRLLASPWLSYSAALPAKRSVSTGPTAAALECATTTCWACLPSTHGMR